MFTLHDRTCTSFEIDVALALVISCDLSDDPIQGSHRVEGQLGLQACVSSRDSAADSW